jgi:lantibiotic modifying enzyme
VERFFSSGVEPEIQLLFRHYPALAGLWAKQISSWQRFAAGFVKDVHDFMQSCRSCAPKPKRVLAIATDLSDLHSGNRSVMRVRFSNGQTWFYKPRSGKKEKYFFELLSYLNRAGFPVSLRIATVVCAKKHFWMAAIPWRSCRTHKELRNFFVRAGALLYLLHYLRGVDFHAANVIANGSHPVIVDCETLLHRKTRLPAQFQAEARSIFRVGMLPVSRVTAAGGDKVSALGRRHRGPHSVMLRGKIVWSGDFVDEIVSGFREMHNFLMRIGVEFRGLAVILSKLRSSPSRVILRPTLHYHILLMQSLQPRKLQSDAVRSAFLREACRHYSDSSRQRKTEVAALLNGDIPIFYDRSDYPLSCSGDGLTEAVRLIHQALAAPYRP